MNRSPFHFLNKNISGFSNVSVLIIVIFSAVLFTSILFIYKQVQINQETTFICQKNIFSDQLTLKSIIEELFSINIKLSTLSKKKKAAEAAVKIGIATVQPEIVSAARLAIKAIEMQRVPLVTKQKSLILRGNFIFTKSEYKTLTELKKYLNLTKSSIRTGNQNNPNDDFNVDFDFKLNTIQFKNFPVRIRNNLDEFPQIELEENFTDKQTLSAFWYVTLRIGIAEGLIWKKSKLKMKHQCSYSLSRKKNKMEVISVRDRFY